MNAQPTEEFVDAIIPNSIIFSRNLSHAAIVAYGLVDIRQGDKSCVSIAIADIAADMGASGATARRALGELKAAGWLTMTRTGRSSVFKLVNPFRRAEDEAVTP